MAEHGIAILMISFAILILIGLNIVYAIGLSAMITAFAIGLPLEMIMQSMITQLNSFSLLAVPFFILAGSIMGIGGITDRLVALAKSIVGWMRGGLAHVNVMASMFFGGISGSAAADTASIGAILIPMMEKDGYDMDFSTSITMASSVQGLLIPPSHNMVIYAVAAGGVSVGQLFMGGMIPGILLGIALMIYCYVISVKRNYPKGERFSFAEFSDSLKKAVWGLGTVLIVVVAVLTGIVTPTESAAIACLYALFVSTVIYKEMTWEKLVFVFRDSIRTLSTILIIACSSAAFGWLVAYLQIPRLMLDSLLMISHNKIVLMLIVNVMLLLIGTFMNMVPAILITTPILLPVVTSVGMSPVQFGIIMILNLGIGLITPPVGTLLYIGSSLSKLSVERLSKAMLPFYLVMVTVLIILTYIPQLSTWLPSVMIH